MAQQQAGETSLMVPYKRIIPGGLQPGKVIIVKGIIKKEAQSIDLNLRHRLGIAFHYNLRFDENVVSRNTFEKGDWGGEDRSGPMPFKRGQQILLTIFCCRDDYKVFVDGKETHTYNHRFTKLEEIDVFDVCGDIELTLVQP